MHTPSIRYMHRNEIDIGKWDRCIEASPAGNVYAYSYYLDHMACRWDALVYNDYEAVWPLTWKMKLGIAYLYQPAFTAALGVFGKEITSALTTAFLSAVPKKFRLIEIELNRLNFVDEDSVFAASMHRRTNFVLYLTRPYDEIAKHYNKNLQRNLGQAAAGGLQCQTGVPVTDVIGLSQQQMKRVSNLRTADYAQFRQLFTLLHKSGKAKTYGVYTPSGELASSAVFFFSHKRAYYILVGNRVEDRIAGASHYLIDRFIYDHAGQDLSLDFEGSDIPGLAAFYAGFGSVAEYYPALRINRLPWIVNALR